jgi:phage head maturation protease
MPLNRCEIDGKPGWKWGNQTCYPYTAGNEESEKAARKKALAQAAAMGEFPGTGQQRSLDIGVEIFERSSPAVLEDVNFKDRTIEVIAVPWDEEAEIVWRGETWKESFEPYALDEAAKEKARVPVNRQHNRADTVGRIVRIDPKVHQRGALASVKVARTPRGDETLQLASEGMLGASVGYFVRKMSDVLVLRRSMTRRVQRAFLDHLSMVEDPAYKGAETVAVHDLWTPHPEAGKRPLATPALDEFLTDDVLSWARQRLSSD